MSQSAVQLWIRIWQAQLIARSVDARSQIPRQPEAAPLQVGINPAKPQS